MKSTTRSGGSLSIAGLVVKSVLTIVAIVVQLELYGAWAGDFPWAIWTLGVITGVLLLSTLQDGAGIVEARRSVGKMTANDSRAERHT